MTAPTPKKQLFVRSWGCQMNVYDSTRMADVLAPLGYAPVGAPEGADMVILNTCHIREKATDKLFSELGRFRAMKAAKPSMVLAVAGCVAQAEGALITARAPGWTSCSARRAITACPSWWRAPPAAPGP
jgi:tRNA-2-methylthio-N6-dimethylallyladenosine synthase